MKAKDLIKILEQNPELEVVFMDNIYAGEIFLTIDIVEVKRLEPTGEYDQLEESNKGELYICIE